MSQAALLKAVVERLQDQLDFGDLDPESIVSLNGNSGQPNPSCGEEFIAVWPGAWSTLPCEGLGETFGFNVTLTRRATYAPADYHGSQVWTNEDENPLGMEERLREILTAIHLDKGRDAVLRAANAIIGSSRNGFVTPCRLLNAGISETKSFDWFGGGGNAGMADMTASGLAQTLQFGGAERYQTIESMA